MFTVRKLPLSDAGERARIRLEQVCGQPAVRDGEYAAAVHRLGVPVELRRVLRRTNPIESAFSRVRTLCQNVKRWRTGDQRERWIGSALLFVQQHFRLSVGCKAMPKLVAILQAYTSDPKKANRVA